MSTSASETGSDDRMLSLGLARVSEAAAVSGWNFGQLQRRCMSVGNSQDW